MKPQDIVLLLKIISQNNEAWHQKTLAAAVIMSQSKVSESVARSKYAGLLDPSGKKVMKLVLLDFLQFVCAMLFHINQEQLCVVPQKHILPSR